MRNNHLQKLRTLQTANFCAFYTARPRSWSTPLLGTWLPTGSNLLGATNKVALIQGILVHIETTDHNSAHSLQGDEKRFQMVGFPANLKHSVPRYCRSKIVNFEPLA